MEVNCAFSLEMGPAHAWDIKQVGGLLVRPQKKISTAKAKTKTALCSVEGLLWIAAPGVPSLFRIFIVSYSDLTISSEDPARTGIEALTEEDTTQNE